MKKIFVILIILLSISMNEKVYSCSCEWSGPFFTVAKGTSLVALVKIKNYGAFSGNIPMFMEVEIIELLKGDDTRKIIKVWGDTGTLCRPYLSRFQSDSIWALSLFKSRSDGSFRHPDEKEGDYNISGCGEYWLGVKNNTVTGLIENVNYNDPQQQMNLSSFIASAKQILTTVEKDIPYSFELNQNYPNPFNPSTTIKYSIPTNQFVTIKVFDMLGREIISLVNENKSAGNYEVKFDGSNLSSGIYFYTMITSQGSYSKKMLLLK